MTGRVDLRSFGKAPNLSNEPDMLEPGDASKLAASMTSGDLGRELPAAAWMPLMTTFA